MNIKSFRKQLGMHLVLLVLLGSICSTALGTLITSATAQAAAGDPGLTATWKDQSTLVLNVNNGITFTESSANGGGMTLTGPTEGACGNDIIVVNPTDGPTGTLTLVGDPITLPTNPNTLSGDPSTGCQTDDQSISITNKNSSVAPGAGPTTGSSTNACGDPCPVPCGYVLRIVWCAFSNLFLGALTGASNLIGSTLEFPVNLVFTDSFEGVFDVFRNLGIGFLVVAGLFMVISESSGLDIFAAHTVRKALPRIVIATIGIALAWPLLKFTITLFNDLGYLVGRVILQTTNTHLGLGNPVAFIATSIITALLAAPALALLVEFLGIGWLLSLAGSALLFIVLGLFVLALRQVVIVLCVLLAPLAIASYVLPSTDKFWKFWKDTLLTTLIMYPIIMGILAAGEALALITLAINSGNPFLTILAWMMFFSGFAFLPFAARVAGGLMTTVINFAQGTHNRTLGGMLRDYRKNELAYQHQQRMEGRQAGPFARFGRDGLYRRLFTRGGINAYSMTGGRFGNRAGEERYQAFDAKRRTLQSQKMLEGDSNIARNDDTTNEILSQRGMTQDRFITEWLQANGLARNADTETRARAALARAEASYDGRVGTDNLRLAAANATLTSPTSFRGTLAGGSDDLKAGTKRYYAMMADLVDDHLMDLDQATGAVKFSPNAAARAERSKESFGGTMTMIQNARQAAADFANHVPGSTDRYIKDDQVERLWRSALKNADPGDWLRGRPESLQVEADIMVENVAQALKAQSNAKAVMTANPGNKDLEVAFHEAERNVQGKLAQISSLYAYLGGVSEEKQEIFGNATTGRVVSETGNVRSTFGRSGADIRPAQPAPGEKTIFEWIRDAEGKQFYQERFKTYGAQYQSAYTTAATAAAAAGAAAAGAAAAAAAATAAGPGAFGPPPGAGPPSPGGTP